jgi:hypothetical protein
MKKFFATIQFRNMMMSAILFVGFMVFGVNNTTAQTVGQNGSNWLTESEAVAKLKDAVQFVKQQQLNNVLPGSTGYAIVEARYHYFVKIQELIETSTSTTGEAVYAAVPFMFTGVGNTTLSPNVLPANNTIDTKALLAEAEDLLTY